MKTCITCKHRTVDSMCTHPKLGDDQTEPDEDGLLYESGPYGDGHGFRVGDHFGCVHHAESDER